MEWQKPPYLLHSSWLLVDEHGDVWFARRSWPSRDIENAPPLDYSQIGRLEPAVFERMMALRDDAAKGKLEGACHACVDCGSLGIKIYGGTIAGSEGVTIAIGQSRCAVSSAPAGKGIAAWMVALRGKVPRLE